MASLQDFCEQIEQLDGSSGYVLITAEGRLVAHSLTDPDPSLTLMTMVRLAAGKILAGPDAGRLNHLSIGLSEGEGLTVFFLGRWLLGVFKSPECDQMNLCRQIRNVVQHYRTVQTG